MKNLTCKICLVVFFCTPCLRVFSKPERSLNNPSLLKLLHHRTDSTAQPKRVGDTSGMGQYKAKSYVLQQDLAVWECNAIGEKIENPTRPIAPQGMTFTVKGVTKNGDLVISFWIWSLKKNAQEISNARKAEKQQFEERDRVLKRETFNFKQFGYKAYAPASIDSVNDNRRYFLLGKDSFTKSCVEYHQVKKWDVNFGTLVTPFKLRFRRFEFANNLSVGGAVYYQRKFDMDWSLGGVFALSLSSVTLDRASTNIHQNATNTNPPLTTSTTRPAFSPSIHGVLSYKNISFTLGVGFDFISKPTDIASATNPEAGWIYNGKPWLGLGLGISLFNNSATKATPNTPGQTPAP